MRFFFDENLSPHLVAGLRGFGEDVVHLTDEFAPGTRDVDWLEVIGNKGWPLVSKDERIRYNKGEREQITRHSVSAFFLGGKKMSRCETIQQVVRAWPEMKKWVAKSRTPFLAKVSRHGKIEPI